jgi:hypothetical protein
VCTQDNAACCLAGVGGGATVQTVGAVVTPPQPPLPGSLIKDPACYQAKAVRLGIGGPNILGVQIFWGSHSDILRGVNAVSIWGSKGLIRGPNTSGFKYFGGLNIVRQYSMQFSAKFYFLIGLCRIHCNSTAIIVM